MTWQPIETAPKDRDILLCWGDRCFVGRWIVASLVHDCDCWMVTGGSKIEPTHWMPLPSLPNNAAQAQKPPDAAGSEGQR